ncbi:hypothetical protein [Mangrovitalea sediminis]|uniref:hypothetical protein n=1 Tax=Mangrovitalea sediminis TaxID=1982043 RepID=UPI001177A5F1|nr:hypothetical protein [Mangrovitalea sediminis]
MAKIVGSAASCAGQLPVSCRSVAGQLPVGCIGRVFLDVGVIASLDSYVTDERLPRGRHEVSRCD